MYTDGRFVQNTPVPDGHIFVGVGQWASPTALNTMITQSAEGNVYMLIPAASTVNLYANPTAILRSGITASFFDGSSAFGTKGPPPVPGPSTIVGTSGPRALPGKPPLTASQMATIAGPSKEPVPKGIRVQAVSVVGNAIGVALTNIQFGMTVTQYGIGGPGPQVPFVINIIPYGNNGIPAIVQSNTNFATINSGNVNFLVPVRPDGTLAPSEIIAHLGITTPAGSTYAFYGIDVGIGYNYN